jgi:hypothetical protein
LRTAPRLRERILDLLARVGGTSFQVPNAAHEEEASKVRAEYDASIAAYGALTAR